MRTSHVPYFYKTASLLFVGINPHPWSAKRKVPFSNNKSFWYHLADAGLIDAKRDTLKDDEFLQNLYQHRFEKEFWLWLINLIDRPSISISDLQSWEEEFWRERLTKIIYNYKPKIVCFVGKAPYEKYVNTKKSDYGWQNPIHNSEIYLKHDPLRGYTSIRIQELQERRKILLSL